MKDNETPNELPDTLIITLDKRITSLNGQESWDEVPLREPYYHEVSAFYKESDKSNPHDAMAQLMAEISGLTNSLSKNADPKIPRGAGVFTGFLNWFPKKLPG